MEIKDTVQHQSTIRRTIDFQLIFESLPYAYLLIAPDMPHFTILAVSNNHSAFTGVKKEQVVNRKLFEAFPANAHDASDTGVNDLRKSLERVIQTLQPDVMGVQRYDVLDKESPTKKYTEKYWTPINSPIFDKNGTLSFILHRVEDVTEYVLSRRKLLENKELGQVKTASQQVEAEILRSSSELKEANKKIKLTNEMLEHREQELAQLNQRLQELDHLKTEFFSNVSHEFRTPLTLMLSPLEDLINEGNLSPSQQAPVDLIYQNALRLLKLVNTLLDFSRYEAGRLQTTFRPTDLSKYTLELASNFSSLVEKGGLTFTIDCPPLPEPIYIDPNLWDKIVLNLLSNAFKHTLSGEISVRLRWLDKKVLLTVQDTGTGIAPEHIKHLFERFYRVPNVQSRSSEGSGIGLSLVDCFVKLHGGNICVESSVNIGTTFTVMIPAGKGHLNPELIDEKMTISEQYPQSKSFVIEGERCLRSHDKTVASEGSSFEKNTIPIETWLSIKSNNNDKARILIVDDNIDMRDYLERLLRPYCEIRLATNGMEGLAIAREIPVDLILSDVMMPKMTGFELLNIIRNDPLLKFTPFVLISARAGEEAKVKGLQVGADDYFVKPFSSLELLTRIKSCIQNHRIRDQYQQALRKSEERYQTLYQWERKAREAALAIQKRFNLDEIFSDAIKIMGEMIHIDHAFIIELDDNKNVLPIQYEFRSEIDSLSLIGKLPPIDCPILTQGIKSKMVLENTINDDHEILNKWIDASGKHSVSALITLPISYHDELYCSLIFCSYQARQWSDREMFFFSILSEKLGIVICKAKIEEKMKLASKLKSQFISNMSHELRTPLNAIICYSEMLLKGMAKTPEMQMRFIDDTRTAGRHLLSLINDILDMSKIEAGKITLHYEKITLESFISNVKVILKELASQNGVELNFTLPSNLTYINADSLRLKQILINLINNAIKFNKVGGKVDVRIKNSLDNQSTIWTIADTGIGIPAAKISNLFSEFYQVDNSMSRKHEGTGLGLSLSKRLIQLHGGDITVESQEGIGSIFTFTLPVVTSEDIVNE